MIWESVKTSISRPGENSDEPSLDETGIHEDDKQVTNEEAATTSAANKPFDYNFNRVVYTKDYLKESSYVYLNPNIHIFHGAEVSVRFMRKKLKRLRRNYDVFTNGESQDRKEILDEDRDDELDELDTDDDEFSDDFETEEEDEDEDDEDDDDTDDGLCWPVEF